MANDGRLRGKAALVTGGAQGIGRESALLFAAEGARVAVVDLSLDGATAVAGEITAAGGEAIALGADVSVDADVARGLAPRLDHGSEYLSDHFLNQFASAAASSRTVRHNRGG